MKGGGEEGEGREEERMTSGRRRAPQKLAIYLFLSNEPPNEGGLATVLASHHPTPVHRLLSLVRTNLCEVRVRE